MTVQLTKMKMADERRIGHAVTSAPSDNTIRMREWLTLIRNVAPIRNADEPCICMCIGGYREKKSVYGNDFDGIGTDYDCYLLMTAMSQNRLMLICCSLWLEHGCGCQSKEKFWNPPKCGCQSKEKL